MEAYGIEVDYKGLSWTSLRDNIQAYIKGMNFSYKVSLQQECTYANQMATFLKRDVSGLITLEYSGTMQGLSSESEKGVVTADRVVIATGGRPNYLGESVCANGR